MIRWIAAAVLSLIAFQPAFSQNPVSAEHRPENLDRMLATKDYVALGKTITGISRQPDFESDLNWLKVRMMEGSSAFVTMLYSRLVWVASRKLPLEQKNQLQQTAAMTTLYAFAAIRIDGSRCGDVSAPSKRLGELVQWNPEIWPFAAALVETDRQILVKLAVALEARTAGHRNATGDFDFLCRAGLEETQYNLAHGTAREGPTPPGGIGKTVVLAGDGKYVPSVKPDVEWQKIASERRATLSADLARLLDSASAGPVVTQPGR